MWEPATVGGMSEYPKVRSHQASNDNTETVPFFKRLLRRPLPPSSPFSACELFSSWLMARLDAGAGWPFGTGVKFEECSETLLGVDAPFSPSCLISGPWFTGVKAGE